jgi:hypothetical protein
MSKKFNDIIAIPLVPLRPDLRGALVTRDVVFRDDPARVQSGRGQRNMAVIKHTVAHPLPLAAPPTSVKNRRKNAGWSADYLATVIQRTA